MKKVIKTIIIFMILLPVIIMAKEYNYENAIKDANSYMDGSNFTQKAKYLIMSNIPFEYDGMLKTNDSFKKGGFLNKYEYELSMSGGKSYLSPGVEYWTMTSKDETNQYYVENSVKYKGKESNSGVRVTQHVLPGTKVKGSGTYSNPWVFEKTNLVQIKTNSVSYGYVGKTEIDELEGISENLDESITYYNFKIKPRTGYSYKTTQGCDVEHLEGNNYKVKNIKGDVTCLVIFEIKTTKYNLTGTYTTEPSPKAIYLKYNVGWFSNQGATNSINKITPPTRTGYTFVGFYTESSEIDIEEDAGLGGNDDTDTGTIEEDTDTDIEDTSESEVENLEGNGIKVIDENGNILSGTKTINEEGTTEESLYAFFTQNKYTVTFDPNGGTPTPSSIEVKYDDTYGDLPEVTKSNNVFDGWYTALTGGTKVENYTVVKTAANHTLYALFTPCPTGTVVSGNICVTPDEPPVVRITVNGAVEDKVTYSGASSGSFVTNSDGKATVSLIPGSYTFTSSVATKTDLSTKYTKSVTITDSTTTVNFYPAGALYWYGNGTTEGSSLFSKCGGILYKTLTSSGESTATIKKYTNVSSWVRIEKNQFTVYMRSSGGTYYSRASCKKTFSKGSYTHLRAIMLRGENNNITDKLEQGYRIAALENGYKLIGKTAVLNRSLSNLSGSTRFYVRAYLTQVSATGYVATKAIWLE